MISLTAQFHLDTHAHSEARLNHFDYDVVGEQMTLRRSQTSKQNLRRKGEEEGEKKK
jgi:hypothetical protein